MSDVSAGPEGGSAAPSYAELVAMVAERDVVIAALTARIAELEARLGADSSNSSTPPSAEGLAKKSATPRRRGGRRGKQPGDAGTHLAQTADPDTVVEHAPSACAGCGGDLTDAEVVGVARRQVFDIPPLRLWVTEHRVQRRRCGCGQTTAAAFPAAASAPVCYGPGVRAVITYLVVYQHLPIDRAARLLADILGGPVATGTVAAVAGQAADAVAPALAVIRARLTAADVVHVDETGARVAGRLT